MFKKYTFDPKKFRLGMRTFKSGLAVFLVILLFGFMGWQGIQIAALTAVFSLREDFDQSVHFGASRILGNSIGGFYALLFFILDRLFLDHFWVTAVFVPIFVMLTIMTNVAMNNKSGIIGGVSALLIITLSIPAGDTIQYVFIRVFETFIGVFIAILVNYDVNVIKKRFQDKRCHKISHRLLTSKKNSPIMVGRKEFVMREKEFRRSLAIFPIGSVMKLTDLTARQIRYYEDQGLIKPDRNEGNRRLYSLNDMDLLLEIKDFLDEGLNIAAIKKEYANREAKAKVQKQQKTLTDEDVRRILHDEFSRQGRFSSPSSIFRSS